MNRCSFGLGEVIDDERICYNSKRCCRRKTCCPCFVVITIAMDIIALIILVSLIVYGFTVGLFVKKKDRDEGEMILELTMAASLIYLL